MLRQATTWWRGKSPRSSIHLDVQPGQVLNSRFRVVHRLGAGQHSNVWLANDTAASDAKVAVKILLNDVSALQGHAAYELEVLQKIQDATRKAPAHAGASHLLQLLQHFRVQGVDGDHLCLVTPLLSVDLRTVRDSFDRKRVPQPLVRHVTRQLLQALDFLHEQCKVVHTDIKPDNIMFHQCGSADLLASKVVLIDLDTAVPERVDRTRMIQPDALRSPEVLLGCPWGVKADIWNLGCIVFELLTGKQLFYHEEAQSGDGQIIPADQYHLAQIYAKVVDDAELKSILIYFVKNAREFPRFFETQAPYRHRFGIEPREFHDVLQEYGIFTPTLDAFLRRMLRVRPEDRSSAKELLNHPWLKD